MGKINSRLKSVAIILLNWNGLEHTSKCLRSLTKVTYPKLRIIVVDNGSSLEELGQLRNEKSIKLIENDKNLGFTGGNNIGIKYAYDNGFDLIMMLNNDTTVEPDFLEPLVAALDSQNVAAVQPKIYTMKNPAMIWSAGGVFNFKTGKPLTLGAGEIDKGGFEEVREIDWITGCGLMFKREMVDRVGYLDDLYFIMCEDVDWSLRARAMGYSLLYTPDSKIYHFESASAKLSVKSSEGTRSPLRQYQNVRNHIFIIRKYVQKRYILFAILDQSKKILIHSMYYLLRGRWMKLKMTFKGLRDGLGRMGEIGN